LSDDEELDVSGLKKTKKTTEEEDAEFEREFKSMMLESMESRRNEVNILTQKTQLNLTQRKQP